MSNKENKHTLLKVLGVTAVAGASAYAGAGYYVFRNAFDLQNSRFLQKCGAAMQLPLLQMERNEWFAHSNRFDDFIDSYDGLKLHALRIVNQEDSHKWIIIQHGIASYSGTLLEHMWEADHRGFNILAPDARGYGMSEGKYTGLGWCEHYDLISWINYLVNLDPLAEIVLFGMNVGAASVMNAVGDYLPRNVKCAIAEGGYKEIKDIIQTQVQDITKFNGKFVMPSVDFYVRQVLHFSLNDISTQRQLRNAVTPMLFLHGLQDRIVPISYAYDNYYSCASKKEMYVSEQGGFGNLTSDPQYFPRFFDFIKKYTK